METRFECQFLGSADTLISGPKLNALTFTNPKTSNAGFDLYEEPQKDHTYVITVDVARGIEKITLLIVVDVSKDHKIVGKYRIIN